jgi:hypothetical protein
MTGCFSITAFQLKENLQLELSWVGSECYLVTRPVPLTSRFLNKMLEKKDGSLQISFVIVINAAITHPQATLRWNTT